MSDNQLFYKTQILTYMGNKRKFLNIIEKIIKEIEKDLNKKLNIGEGFSGSGIVSRLFKNNSNNLYVNDIAGYSYTLNNCYLSTPSQKEYNIIKKYIDKANKFVETNVKVPKFISKHWAPKSSHITENDRVYFTHKNGIRIDKYMYFINNKVEEKYKPYLLAPLLVECSMHNNTNGQFSAYYKNENRTAGKYGGKNEIDLNRITMDIKIQYPILSNHNCNVNISQNDTNEWCKSIPELDLVYYDPPYNKHPYCIYYFLLDIINDWNLDIEIPNTYRGQPKNWKKSKYCSITKAKATFQDLIKFTKSKYILISYNDGGIIPLNELEEILTEYGSVSKIPVEHKTYNKLKGIASYKRKKENKEVKEFLWLLKKN